MAEFGLTPAGFNRKRLADFKTSIETALKIAFGEDIDLEPESGFGQFVGLMAEALGDESESQEDVYNSQYPSTASNASLSDVVTYNGIERQSAQDSTAVLTITGTEGTIIPQGSEASVNTTSEVFVTDVEVTIPVSGSITVGSTAENTGPITASIGSIIVIDTPIFGWTAVTNTAAAIVGIDEETDPDLRERRELSTFALGQNLVDSLFGQLLDIDDVEDAVVISNGLDVTSPEGIPAHQFISVISGGAAAEIGLAIWKNTPQGILSFGAATEIITDDQGFPQETKYTRPSDVDIFFRVDITIDAAEFPGTGEADIQAAVAAYGTANFKISDDVIRSEFYTPINETPGVTSIDLRIGLSASPTGTSNIPIDIDEISRYDSADVEVNIV